MNDFSQVLSDIRAVEKEEAKPEWDGGWAFPSNGTMGEVTWEGMTLRDYFAAKALAAILSKGLGQLGGSNESAAVFASKCAYEVADAMLKARGE